MSLRSNLKVDFDKWAKHPAVHQLTQHLGTYEKRLSTLVKDFDLKGRSARERSRKKLDKLVVQLRQTRGKVEKRINTLVNAESKKLNKRVNELVSYLTQVARQEDRKMAASGGRAKKNTGSRRKASSTKRSTRSRK